MKRDRQSLAQVFAPLVGIAVVSVFGLVVALTGDGWRDIVAWIALAMPVAILLWAAALRRG